MIGGKPLSLVVVGVKQMLEETPDKVKLLIRSLIADLNTLSQEINMIVATNSANTVVKVATTKNRNIMKKYQTDDMQSILQELFHKDKNEQGD